ncbi:PadR family transcriptional regulator [Actinomyces sp. zg296]|uniref:PadR family transcriptional regulator n=1 Tax=Actinomyces sp. zg296 TaxID=2609289 RepID=UPI0013599E68|nr:PadR family transcriptional regulator [Actinomyces sp. zg296]
MSKEMSATARAPKGTAAGAAEPQLRKGALELAVLALVERAEPDGIYGGALIEELSALPTLTAPQGTVYPLLSRLRAAGVVETTWQESPSGPPRRYYLLTEAGRERLAAQRRVWLALSRDMAALLDSAATTTRARGTRTREEGEPR